MATCVKFSNLSTTVPTLVFQGSGEVRLSASGAGSAYIGGSNVDTDANGLGIGDVQFRVLSSDEIYAIATAANTTLRVFSVR